MRNGLTYIAWLMLLLAVGAWAGVGLFAAQVSADEAAHASALASSRSAMIIASSAARVHALVQDTSASRASLDTILGTGVVTIANDIDEAGKAAGVKAKVTSALPENNVSNDIHALQFTVDATGSFAGLVRLLQLFEAMPLPAKIERFDLQIIPDTKKATSWHLSVSLRVLTTASISP